MIELYQVKFMIDIIIATNNQDKMCEISTILKPYGFNCLSLKDVGFFEDIEEDGESFFDNAYKKAKIVSQRFGKPALGDESGLEVEALPGELGVRSKRFYVDNTYKENNLLLLEKLKNVHNRKAHFISQIVLYFPGGKFYTYKGKVDGEIALDFRGDFGFGYDPLFIIDGMNKRMAELTRDEKNAVSHRGRALVKLIEDIKNENISF